MKKIYVASIISLSMMTTSITPSLANDQSGERATMLSVQHQDKKLDDKMSLVNESLKSSGLKNQIIQNEALHERINSTEFSTLPPLEKNSLLIASFELQLMVYQELNKDNWTGLSLAEWKMWQKFLESQDEQVEKKIQRMNSLLIEASTTDKKMMNQLKKLHKIITKFEKESLLLESSFSQKVNELNKIEIDISTQITSLSIAEGRTVDAIESWLNIYDYMKNDSEYFEILDTLGENKSPVIFMNGEKTEITEGDWDSEGALWITPQQATQLLGREIERSNENTWIFRHQESKVEWNKERTLIDEHLVGNPLLVSQEGKIHLELLLNFMGYEVKIHEQRYVIEVIKKKSLPHLTKWTFDDIRKIIIIK